jgi:hypothetical protein
VSVLLLLHRLYLFSFLTPFSFLFFSSFIFSLFLGLYVLKDDLARWPPPTVAVVACPAAATPSCSDRTENGLETGIDCGGPCDPCRQAGELVPRLDASRWRECSCDVTLCFLYSAHANLTINMHLYPHYSHRHGLFTALKRPFGVSARRRHRHCADVLGVGSVLTTLVLWSLFLFSFVLFCLQHSCLC